MTEANLEGMRRDIDDRYRWPIEYDHYGQKKLRGVIYDTADFFKIMREQHPDIEFRVEDDVANRAVKLTAITPDGEWLDETLQFEPGTRYEGGALMAAYEKIKPKL